MDKQVVVTGMIRKLKNFMVFWPENVSVNVDGYRPFLPHYVILKSPAKSDVFKSLYKKKSATIKVLATISNDAKEGMDGTIIIYKVTAVPLTFTSMPSDWDRLDHHEAGRLGVKPSSPVSQTN